jgi:ATP-dependent RNA helicase DDX24/MAK5
LGFGAGFLELEEIDGADYGIFGTIVEDVGAGERKVGNDQKRKTKRGKRKRGDGAKCLDADVGGDCADGLVAESKEEEGETAEEKGKRKKRNRKKRKVNDKEKDSESKEDATDDNVEEGKKDVTDDNAEEGKKGEKKGKKKRNRKKRKVNDEDKDSDNKDDVTDDTMEGA